jgi:hypothetical protein
LRDFKTTKNLPKKEAIDNKCSYLGLEIELSNELKTQVQMKKLQTDLIGEFDFAFNWVMDMAQKDHLELPNKEGVFSCVQRIQILLEEIYGKSPDSDHRFGSTRRFNKTKFTIRTLK